MDANTVVERGRSIFPPPEKMWPPPKTHSPQTETPKKNTELVELKKLDPRNISRAQQFYKVLIATKDAYNKGCQIDMKTDPLQPKQEPINEQGIIPTKAFINIDYGSTQDVASCEVVIGDRHILFSIDSQGKICGDIAEEPDINLLLTNIFVNTKKGVVYANFVEKGSRNLEFLSNYKPITEKREGSLVINPVENSTGAETIGAELEDIDSNRIKRIRTKISLETFRLEGGEQAKPIEGVDRKEIAKDALNTLLQDTRGKISPDRYKELESLATSGQVLFLNNDEYSAFVGEGQTEEDLSAASAFGTTIDKNLILINQNAITSFPEVNPQHKPNALETYKLMRTNDGDQEHYDTDTRETMQKTLSDQIGYTFGINRTPRENTNSQIPDVVIRQELMKNLLWSIVYHEGLHFATDNTHFLTGLNEAATHYKTAQATNERLGKNAFCGYVMASGLEHAINWTAFLGTFPITEDVANEMYFNPKDEWTMKKIFDAYPNERHAELLHWLQYGESNKPSGSV